MSDQEPGATGRWLRRITDSFSGEPRDLDELAEVLTLVQTGKSRRIPIILVGAEFWRGLLDWFADTLIPEGMIDAGDLESKDPGGALQLEATARTYRYLDASEVAATKQAAAKSKAKPGAKK